MARPSTDSILNSLKGRIWLAASAMAILNCICGLGAYLAVSFFSTDPFSTIFATCLIAAFTTLVFGWWLSNEVTRPIETVSLLAKSLERSPSASLPKTTGSSETDELLRTLHRNSQQLQNLISLMDDVASGKTDAATLPLQHSDRLSASFQKLVAKVTDSISAKQELDELTSAVARITADISGVRNGKLDVNIRAELPQTKEITDSFRYLTGRLNELVRQVQLGSADAGKAVTDVRKSLRSAIENREEQAGKVSRNFGSIYDGPLRMQSIVGEFASALTAIESSFGLLSTGQGEPDEAGRSGRLRAQISDAVKKVQKLRDRSQAIPQLGRSAEELARRSNLIALNTSIQGNDSRIKTQSASLLSEEIGSLSEKSELLSKEIRSTNETLVGEIAELESVLGSMTGEIAEIAKSIAKNTEFAGEFANYFAELARLQSKISVYSTEQSVENEKIEHLISEVSGTGDLENLMRESEQNVQKLANLVEGLRDSVSDFQPASVSAEKPPPRFKMTEPEEPTIHPEQSAPAEPIDLPGEN